MDISTAISGRRSARDFTAQAIDDETIRGLIDAAALAPSASNGQPWTFTVVRDQALLDLRERPSVTLAWLIWWGSGRPRTWWAEAPS